MGENKNGWSKWVRHWTAEEKSISGDVLNNYLYLSGRCYMREVEMDYATLDSRWFLI